MLKKKKKLKKLLILKLWKTSFNNYFKSTKTPAEKLQQVFLYALFDYKSYFNEQ